MSYQEIGGLPRQVMEEDSPEYTLEFVDDYIKKDLDLINSRVLIDSSEAIIDPADVMIHPAAPVYYEEETMPVASVPSHIPQEHVYPYPHHTGPPDQTIYPGPYNFTAKVSSKSNKNSKFLYSECLNKIYADINCDFPVQFSWSGCACAFVRARVVFAAGEHAGKRVECCMQHRHAPNVPENIRLNVLRSSRELGTAGVYYHGDPENPDSWYSVVVEFPAGLSRAHAYKFACKNSCSSGINRRAIAILFTLEDHEGKVYGRQVIGARVCSCPPRDLRKDEETAGVPRSKKRLAKPSSVPSDRSKKVKIESPATPGDAGMVTLPSIQLVDANVLTAGLQMMVKMTEHGRNLRNDDPQYVQACNVSIDNLKTIMEQYRRDDNV